MKANCSTHDIIARIVALEAEIKAHKELMDEREKRYTLRSDSQDKAVSTAMDSAKAALNKAEMATEKRLEGLNELRAMAESQASAFARKDAMDLKQQSTDKRIDDISDVMRQNMARGLGIKETWGYIVAFGSISIAALAIYLKH